jgi:zinc protease
MKLQRKIQPLIWPVELKSIPEADLCYLDNGIPVYLINAGTQELMRVEYIFNAGQIKENFPLVASTTNAMLLEGSANFNAKEINSAFDYYGAFVNPFIQKDSSGLTIFFLNKHIRKITELCYEILFRPVFPEEELINLQKKRLQTYMMNRKRVQSLASDKFFESVFGNYHPYGKKILPNDFGNVTGSKLQEFHRDFYKNGSLTIIISGKIHAETIPIINQLFGKHDFGTVIADTKEIQIKGNKTRKVYVNKKNAVQSAIRIGSATINKKHREYNGLSILDTILGGYFGSRLMKNLREDKGYTYGIHSSLISLNQSGYKVIATEVGVKHTKEALDEIYKEIRVLQTRPVEIKELDVIRSYMAGEMVRMFDGPFALAESFRAVWEFGLNNNYYYNLAEKIKTINPDEIIDLANRYYDIKDLYEIIAGHK